MEIYFLNDMRQTLLQWPLYTGDFILTDAGADPMIAMRVDDISLLQRAHVQLISQIGHWRDHHGTWVVVFPFRLLVNEEVKAEGLLGLNPRHTPHYQLLQRLSTMEQLQWIFFSPDLRESVSAEVEWSVTKQQYVHQLLAEIAQTLSEEHSANPHDADFVHAKEEFLRLHPLTQLLDGG